MMQAPSSWSRRTAAGNFRDATFREICGAIRDTGPIGMTATPHFVFPVHYNPTCASTAHDHSSKGKNPNIHLMDPVGYRTTESS